MISTSTVNEPTNYFDRYVTYVIVHAIGNVGDQNESGVGRPNNFKRRL